MSVHIVCRTIPVSPDCSGWSGVFIANHFGLDIRFCRKIADVPQHLRLLGMAGKWLPHPKHVPSL